MTVTVRLDNLAQAIRAGRGVLPDDLVVRAREVGERAGHRLRLSAEHTVVAFAGSTGSGKSSLLNAVIGLPLAEVDVLRPTTSEAFAVVRGEAGSAPLLDWLGVRRRHQLPPVEPPAGAAPATGDDEGLVLIDLPDHDSVRTEHRLEAERLVALVDLMVWVVDPQKYADAAVHERYLRTLGAHAEVVFVVLNQVDRLTVAERAACRRDLERLLADDGLPGVRVLEVSARTGEGVAALRAALDEAAHRRVAAQARLEADVIAVAGRIRELCGGTDGAPHASRTELVDALAQAAGVPVVVEAVRRAHLLHARAATGWPLTRWVARFRVDPLRRLHLGPGSGGSGVDGSAPRGSGRRGPGPTATARGRRGTLDEVIRTSVPPPGQAELARARAAVRAFTDSATTGSPDLWVLAARARTDGIAQAHDLPDALDRAVSGTPVAGERRPLWWSVVGGLQWLLLAFLVAGLGWLGVLAGLGVLRIPVPDPPAWGEVSLPTAAVVVGVLLGPLVAGLARLAAATGARARARRAGNGLRAAVAQVADQLVVEPVDEVLARLRACRTSADRAGAPSNRSRRATGRRHRDKDRP
ncbi:GTPase [Cellulomonas sp. KRMCY2]|uniref:GTPase n=1 Tax=Cellulomonas sp. KRMCY2 TaxID=1304865 RepID=UPI0009DCB5F2|nr:GTPase [Cellulomonas sp. KRMCY2]